MIKERALSIASLSFFSCRPQRAPLEHSTARIAMPSPGSPRASQAWTAPPTRQARAPNRRDASSGSRGLAMSALISSVHARHIHAALTAQPSTPGVSLCLATTAATYSRAHRSVVRDRRHTSTSPLIATTTASLTSCSDSCSACPAFPCDAACDRQSCLRTCDALASIVRLSAARLSEIML